MAELTKAELQERAMLIRAHESNCKIEHPSADELGFRLAIMKKLAKCFGLAELRQYGFGPATPTTAPRAGVTAPAKKAA